MWLFYAMLAAITWGLNYTLDGKVLNAGVPPLYLLAGQAWLGALVFTTLAYVHNSHHPMDLVSIKNTQTLWIYICSLIVANLGTFFIVISMGFKNSTIVALIEQTYPIFTIIFSWVLFREHYLNKMSFIGGILIILGATVVALGET